jgi:hypothetical protein
VTVTRPVDSQTSKIKRVSSLRLYHHHTHIHTTQLAMAPIQVNIKHAGKTYNLPLDPDLPPAVFKDTVYNATGVPPDRMKVMVKGGVLKVCLACIAPRLIFGWSLTPSSTLLVVGRLFMEENRSKRGTHLKRSCFRQHRSLWIIHRAKPSLLLEPLENSPNPHRNLSSSLKVIPFTLGIKRLSAKTHASRYGRFGIGRSCMFSMPSCAYPMLISTVAR